MGAPLKREKTAAQVVVSYGSTYLVKPPTYATYRQMTKHPTIAIGRALSSVPVLSADWTVESDDDVSDEWVQLVQDQVLNKRHQFLEHAVYGRVDYGFAPFEKVWGVQDGFIILEKIKPLSQELTELLTWETTGALCGLKQSIPRAAGVVALDLDSAMVLSFNVRGTNWYGEALLENDREAWNCWMEANEGAKRYDQKVAGGHVIVKFPQGSSDYSGQEQDNQDIAASILNALQSAGSVCVPTNKQENGMGQMEDQWDIQFDDSGSGMQPQFRDRLEYFDKLIARGLLLPERALQEGSHGTLAEADSHGEVALAICELAGQSIIRGTNEQLVDPLLTLNFGMTAKGRVRIISSPLANKQRAFLEQVYTAYLGNPSGFLTESDQIDMDSLKDLLGVPKSQEIAEAGTAVASDIDPNDSRASTTRRLYQAEVS